MSKRPKLPLQKPDHFLAYAGMATEMALTILAAVFAGRWLDQNYLPEFPLYTLLCALSGVFIALYRFISKL